MEASRNYEEQYNFLAERYEVEGVLTPQTKVIFILESPHVAEVKNRVPVAGLSGSTMSKKLFGEEYTKPLGLLLKRHMEEEIERPSLDLVGLLNVCNVPMQKKPYDLEDIEAAEELLNSFETIRTSNHKSQFKEDRLNDIQQLLLTKFQKRLKGLTDQEITMVPCGKFAQKFFKLANVMSTKWTIVEGVPHPSYNSWSRDRYQSSVNKVVEELKRHKL